jgi:hypothetical protein
MATRTRKRIRPIKVVQEKVGRETLENTLLYGVCCGSMGGLAANAGVAFAALEEGRSPWQPFNATSHWLRGKKAAQFQTADFAHTVPGIMTNQAAAMFWGAVLGTYFALRPPRSNAGIFRDAAWLGTLALLVDYGLLPRRLSPGWHLALSRKSVLIGFMSMSLGLGLGGVAARRLVIGANR